MRIITGEAKGKRLDTLEGLETRPTTEKVKEAIFSMIQFEVEGRRVLDLFAGSGQLGLEALSRGASLCTFVEKSREAFEIVKGNAKKTGLFDRSRVLNSDYMDYLKTSGKTEKFDIIFLDPPYSMKIIPGILDRLVKHDIIARNGLVVCESEDDIEYAAEGLEVVRHSKYGRVYITLLRRTVKED